MTSPSPGLLVADRYRLLAELARGGNGIVYCAEDIEIGRIVALKITRPGGPAERLLREARIAARLSHPDIVHVLDGGRHEGLPFFVMEFLKGETLSRRLSRGRLSADEASGLIRRLARALSHAHARGVIHRDLKPGNVILSDRGPVLTDFGLARDPLSTERLTESGELLGTPLYMAPEQISGRVKDADARCDIYALGAILYEMVAGRPPFEASSFSELSFKVLHERPVPPPHFAHACLGALEKNPTRRFPSTDAFLAALDRPAHRRFGLPMAATAGLLLAAGLAGVARPESPRPPGPRLMISSRPSGARVILDGRKAGETPLTLARPREGIHELRLEAPGYAPQSRRLAGADDDLSLELKLFTPGTVPHGMRFVPGGTYEIDGRRLELPPFFIDRAPVSGREYERFLQSSARPQPDDWKRNRPPEGFQDAPVTGLSYEDANAFARWCGKRLPTPDQWTIAEIEGGGVREWMEGRLTRGASAIDPPEEGRRLRPQEGRSPLVGFRCVMDAD